MAVATPKDVFVRLLSNVRQGSENAATIYRMMSEEADQPEIKEALHARAFVAEKVHSTLDECFKMIGEQPAKSTGRIYDIFVEDFRKDLGEIESQEGKRLFILAKAHQLNHLRMGEYTVLIEAADMSGHYGVGLLLATCMADMVAFAERTRHLVRRFVEGKIELKRAM